MQGTIPTTLTQKRFQQQGKGQGPEGKQGGACQEEIQAEFTPKAMTVAKGFSLRSGIIKLALTNVEKMSSEPRVYWQESQGINDLQ